jgi:ribosome maturation factor RimP
MAAGAPTGQRARIAALVEPVIVKAGYDLEDVTVTQAGRRSLVKIVVDADGGVSLDDIAEVSRAVSAVLDDADADGGMVGRSPYTLEVTSPGVDRPLTQPRHWRRNVGRLVKVRVGEESLTGRIVATSDATVTLDIDGAAREFRHAELGGGKVQVEFGRPEKAPDAATVGDDATVGEDA